MDKRGIFQRDSVNKWIDNNYIGTTTATTGTGKSKVLVDSYLIFIDKFEQSRSVIFAPTHKLISNWYDELDKWLGEDNLSHNKKNNTSIFMSKHIIEFSTYSSTHKYRDQSIDFMGLDEIHNALSDARFDNLMSIKAKAISGLTATIPPQKENQDKLLQLCPVISQLDVKKSLKMKLIQDFNVHIIDVKLNNTNKVYKKFNSKYTELEMYNEIIRDIEYAKEHKKDQLRFLYFNRMNLMFNTYSKIKSTLMLLTKMKKNKTLVFTQSIINAELISKGNAYHSKSGDDKLNKFINDEIQLLASVKSLNEGITIPKLSHAIIVSADSTEKNMTQRIGRTLRLKDNDEPSDIIILRHPNTVDEIWVKNALKKFPKANIKTYTDIQEFISVKQK